ncbi:hypothetical protein HYS31_05045 [Candidatus Woesearchaeota archaeon]|nr:hypothetical protein [Candidatus Woesearchaeota archaeon]
MYFKSNKKASLEISIQAIVIVVLAMTLLGLGLGFIKGMFRNISSTTEDVSEQVRQKILDDLVQGDKKISFPKTEILIDKGGSQVLTVGIRNKLNAALDYKLKFELIDPTVTTYAAEHPKTEQEVLDELVPDKFVKNFQHSGDAEYHLTSAESDIRNVRLTIPTLLPSGSYFLTFKILTKKAGTTEWTEVYAQKDFFVVVRG